MRASLKSMPSLQQIYEKQRSLTCRICCSFPHGYIMLLPMFLLVLGFILSSSVLSSCELMYVEINTNQFFKTMGTNRVGLFSFYNQTLEECRPFLTERREGYYSMPPFDAYFKTAQSFGVIANISGGVIMILILNLGLCVMSHTKYVFKIFSFVTFLITAFQSFVFFMYGSNDCFSKKDNDAVGGYDCGFYTDAWLVVGSSLAWLLASVSLCLVADPDRNSKVTVTTVTETKLSDGRKFVVTKVVKPDGTKEITKEKMDAEDSMTIGEIDEEKAVKLDLNVKFDVDEPEADVKVKQPEADVKVKQPEADIEQPKVYFEQPLAYIEQPKANADKPEADVEQPGEKGGDIEDQKDGKEVKDEDQKDGEEVKDEDQKDGEEVKDEDQKDVEEVKDEDQKDVEEVKDEDQKDGEEVKDEYQKDVEEVKDEYQKDDEVVKDIEKVKDEDAKDIEEAKEEEAKNAEETKKVEEMTEV